MIITRDSSYSTKKTPRRNEGLVWQEITKRIFMRLLILI
jgi:hypothetical protein